MDRKALQSTAPVSAPVIRLDPEALIAKGIEHGISVEGLERLLAMRERLKVEQARSAYVRALAEFQGGCPIIIKDQVVRDKTGKERYRYAPLDSIIKQVGSLLRASDMTYRIDTRIEEGQTTALVATCVITHLEGHSESSEFRVPIDRDSYMSEPQKFGAASTYAKRYALCNALGILTGDQDTDAVKDMRPRTTVEVSLNTEGPQDLIEVEKAGFRLMELLGAEDAAGLSAYIRTLNTGVQLSVWNKFDSKVRRRIKELISEVNKNASAMA